MTAPPEQTPPAAAPRRRMTASARREQLLETAREVFLRRGYGETTVRDISDAAEVNVALLYRHFQSKEELFDAAVAQPLEEALKTAVEGAAHADVWSGRPDLQRAIVVDIAEALLTAMAQITPLLGVVLFSDRGAAFYRDHVATAIETVSQAAKTAMPDAAVRPYDTEVVANVMVGLCLSYGLREQFGGPDVDRRHVAEELTELIFDGIVER